MIDRATNLLVLFIAGVAVLGWAAEAADKWRFTESWEKAWVLKDPNAPAPFASEALIRAYRNASEAHDDSSARELLHMLERFYTPAAWVLKDPNVPAPYASEALIRAYRNASEAHEDSAAREILGMLERFYTPSAWVLKDPNVPAPYASERPIRVYRNASEAHDDSSERELVQILERFYTPSAVLVRFSGSEIRDLAVSLASLSLLFLLPLSMNYLRHGDVRLWNRSASKSRNQWPDAAD